MEQDKNLKNILLNSAPGASDDFTDAVMHRVYSLKAAPDRIKPLANSKWEKAFVFAFGALVLAIFGLCFIIALSNLNMVGWMRSITVPDMNYNQVLQFIFIFWMLFALNKMFQKKSVAF